ncbi:MAG: hypothetical protein M1382_03690 [Candidatus Marsarchaeota archaeon]|jgi:hypothetical protein|nr:hypothetical protein [Candidatus Marsarchaeota archaeon]
MSYTTIQINKETRLRLQKFRISKRETYDEILNTLMDLIPSGDDEGEYTEEFKYSIIKGLLDIKHGRTYTLEQVEKKLGLA